MKNTLLISTYNWKEALDLVLQSIEKQSQQPDELIIADDGSTLETKEIIDDFKKAVNFPVKHVWHEDKGFRKSTILNKAIAQSSGEYIIQADGDCILHRDFVKDHIRFSQAGIFLYGSRVNIQKEFLPTLFSKQVVSFTLFSKGIKKRTRALHVPFLSSFYQPESHLPSKLRGCNISFWKDDFIHVNGYNEELTGWGREDSELFARILNSGVKARRIRYAGIVYHIWHKELSKDNLKRNTKLQQQTMDRKITFCENGIDKYL